MEPVYIKRRQRALAVTIAALVLLVGATVYIGVSMSKDDAPDYRGTGNGVSECVEIPEGSTLSDLAPELVERGIVASNAAFRKEAFANKDAQNVNPGFYHLQQHMSAQAAVDALLDQENYVDNLLVPGGATLMDVTVVGGKTTPGIFSNIAALSCPGEEGGLTVESLEDVAAHADPATLGVPAWALEPVLARGEDPRRLEGLIAPGEYVVDPRADATTVLKSLISKSAEQYQETGLVERAGAEKLTPYQLLTAASLVEREASTDDFPKVARVILNRLAVPQRLQFDSTVNYGLPDQEVATTDVAREEVTPWNTYAMDGLPSTPIASPSLAAIEAMENPADGPWLYFVTVDTEGTTVFSATIEEHQAATQEAINNGVLDSQRAVTIPADPAAPTE